MSPRYKILEKYNFQVPRYTSYPPATQFKEEKDEEAYIGWLSNTSGKVSLYVHIPFCARLCHYCGCNMRVVNNYDPVKDYLQILKSEVSLLRTYIPAGTIISHLHFGGGSPTIVKPEDFRSLVEFISETFPFDSAIEIGVEADPRNISETKIAAYASSGVNRISLGVQDFDEEVLKLINRPQPFHVTYRAVALCRAYGIENINFDLMYGLPGQTEESILQTIDLALALKPSRISYFGYAHVPWVKRHMNLMPQERIPGPSDRYILQESGASFIERKGYIPIGIDHFALPEDSMVAALNNKTLHRNFQGYTTDSAEYLIGLGSSSIGAFPKGYIQNKVDIRQYAEALKDNRLPVHKSLTLKQDDLPVKRIIEEIMCYLKVDLKDICKNFSLPESYFEEEMERIKALEQDGVAYVRGSVIEVNPAYRVLARVVCEVFDRHAMKEMSFQRHAQAV